MNFPRDAVLVLLISFVRILPSCISVRNKRIIALCCTSVYPARRGCLLDDDDKRLGVLGVPHVGVDGDMSAVAESGVASGAWRLSSAVEMSPGS